jgi:hypothetical protein
MALGHHMAHRDDAVAARAASEQARALRAVLDPKVRHDLRRQTPAVRIAFALRPRPRVGEDTCLRELSLGVVILNEEKRRA